MKYGGGYFNKQIQTLEVETQNKILPNNQHLIQQSVSPNIKMLNKRGSQD